MIIKTIAKFRARERKKDEIKRERERERERKKERTKKRRFGAQHDAIQPEAFVCARCSAKRATAEGATGTQGEEAAAEGRGCCGHRLQSRVAVEIGAVAQNSRVEATVV